MSEAESESLMLSIDELGLLEVPFGELGGESVRTLRLMRLCRHMDSILNFGVVKYLAWPKGSSLWGGLGSN